jgi:nickel superoxide dismutase
MRSLIKNLIYKLLSIKVVHAHCDIPCGIYDPIAAKIAAQTVLKMVMRIETLDHPTTTPTPEERASYVNSLSRYISVKEEHAEIAKKEIDILWHDYFKPEHLEKFPELHTTIWNTTKLASTNKQMVSIESATNLVGCVDKIAKIFWATKGVDYTDPMEKIRFGS